MATPGWEGCGGSALLVGLCAMEVARVDSSMATFSGVHSGVAMSSIYLCGTEEQPSPILYGIGWSLANKVLLPRR